MTAHSKPRRAGLVGAVVGLLAGAIHSNNASATPTPPSIGYGIAPSSLRYGNTPADWGRSAACARMVRKSRLRRLGWGGDKI
jgi:hypothetical protein